jgi:uncharacterized membrane protein
MRKTGGVAMAGQRAEQQAAVEAARHVRGGVRRPPSRHPVNRELYDAAPLGPRIADAVTGFMGSWRFIAIQTLIVLIWISGNVYLLFHFDPYPFILLNLAFSTQAAYAAPLILLAGNRSAIRDRMTLEHTAEETDLEARQNQELLKGNQEILQRVEALEQRILQLETNILGRIDASRAGG